MRKSSIVSAIGNRIWRDLIHNPLHLIFAVDVLGMTSSTLASLSKGFAELSTDGQFMQLRSKQVSSHINLENNKERKISSSFLLQEANFDMVSGIIKENNWGG